VAQAEDCRYRGRSDRNDAIDVAHLRRESACSGTSPFRRLLPGAAFACILCRLPAGFGRRPNRQPMLLDLAPSGPACTGSSRSIASRPASLAPANDGVPARQLVTRRDLTAHAVARGSGGERTQAGIAAN
jgi:hypothetical protein